MGSDTQTHRALADGSRVRILELLRHEGRPLDTRELASLTGLHPSTVRSHLEMLVDTGLVNADRETRRTPGRPRMLYQAVKEAPAGPVPGSYRLLAEILASHLAGTSGDPVAAAMEAGEAWGGHLVERPPPYTTTSPARAREVVRELLDRVGFAPQMSEDGTVVRLRRCPFLDIAREHPDVVCSVHLGLMRGALRALGTTVKADSLEPFVEPSLCLAHLSET